MYRFSDLEDATAARPTRGAGPLLVDDDTKPWGPPIRAALRELPKHHCYVEVGVPSFPLFVAKRPSPIEVVNDCEHHFRDFFGALRDPKRLKALVARHKRFAAQEPSLGRLVASLGLDKQRDEKIYVWFRLLLNLLAAGQRIVSRASLFPERIESVQTWAERDPLLQRFYALLRRIDTSMPELHGRLMRVQYESRDSLSKLVEIYDGTDTAFFAYAPNAAAVKQLRGVRGAVLLVGPDTRHPRQFRLRCIENGTGVWVKQCK